MRRPWIETGGLEGVRRARSGNRSKTQNNQISLFLMGPLETLRSRELGLGEVG